MVFYQLLSIVKLKLNGFPTSTNCDHLNLQLSSANHKQLKVQRPYTLCETLFVFVFEYFTLFEYIRLVFVFMNSIRYSFQIAKRILFSIRIRSKITILVIFGKWLSDFPPPLPQIICRLGQIFFQFLFWKYSSVKNLNYLQFIFCHNNKVIDNCSKLKSFLFSSFLD